MVKYYYLNRKTLIGPVSLRELSMKQELGSETLVWRKGLEDWQQAKEVPELQLRFERKEIPAYIKRGLR